MLATPAQTFPTDSPTWLDPRNLRLYRSNSELATFPSNLPHLLGSLPPPPSSAAQAKNTGVTPGTSLSLTEQP